MSATPADGNELGEGARQAAYRRWWQPVLDAPLDDPDQEPPKLYWPNNIRAQLPIKGTWVLCYASDSRKEHVGVCTAGRTGYYEDFVTAMAPFKDELLAELPQGTEFRSSSYGGAKTFIVRRERSEFGSDEEARAWLAETLNTFVNVFRPRLRRLTAT